MKSRHLAHVIHVGRGVELLTLIVTLAAFVAAVSTETKLMAATVMIATKIGVLSLQITKHLLKQRERRAKEEFHEHR